MTATHAAHPGRVTDEDPGRRGILASMCLSLVLVVASVSSVNLALTGISLDLETTSSQLTWVADGYTVALAALVLPFGALGDRLGRRTLLLVGTAIFGIAAIGAAAAQTPEVLIASRVLMGVGAAMIMPGTLSTITAVFPADKRSHAVSVWAGFATSGAILGLLGSGALLEGFSWRSTFVGTAVLAAVSFVAALVLAPNTADPEEASIDLPGFLLSAMGIGALVFGIIDGAEAGWTTTNAMVGLGTAAAALLAFVWWERRTERPMLDVRLFANRGFSVGTAAITAQFLCMFGFFLVGLQFLQLMLDYSPLVSALCLLPMATIVMPVSRLAPHLVERFGQRNILTIGLATLGFGLLVMSFLSADSTYWQFLGGLFFVGLGMALTSTPSTTAIVTSLPRAKQGVGSAVNDVSRELGSALGIAILGSLFNRGYSGAMHDATAGLPPEAAHAVEESPGAALAVAGNLGDGGARLADAARDAFATGLGNAMTAGAVIALVMAAAAFVFAPRHPQAVEEEDHAVVTDEPVAA